MKLISVLVGLAALTLGGCATGGSAGPTVVVTVTATPGSTPSSANPSVEPSASVVESAARASYEDILVGSALTSAAICQQYTSVVDRFSTAAQRRLTAAKGATKDSYAAASFRRYHRWVRQPLSAPFQEALQSSATDALNSVSDGRAGTVDSVDDYLTASLEACGLGDELNQAKRAVDKADGLASQIVSLAARKPWYPRGYDEVQDGIAFKWLENVGNDCYGCRYWTADVIPRDGCPSSLYVELSIEDRSGAAIGYTNDAVGRVQPMQRARMSFETYEDAAARASIAEVSCY